MTAKQTLYAAQSLYEQKLITYLKTGSQYLTEDMEDTARNVVRQIHEKYKLMGPFLVACLYHIRHLAFIFRFQKLRIDALIGKVLSGMMNLTVQNFQIR